MNVVYAETAQRAYEAYCSAQGMTPEPWTSLTQREQDIWVEVVIVVVDLTGQIQ